MDPYKIQQMQQIQQVPIAPNNNLIKIGGSIIAVFIFIIILVMLYNSFTSSTPKLEKRQVFRCELFSDYNFINSNESLEEIKKRFPDINKDTITSSINIIDSEDIELSNIFVKSIKSTGYVITTYSKPDYTGNKFTLTDNKLSNKIEIQSMGPIRSIKVKKVVQ
jgi:hypothetical protein